MTHAALVVDDDDIFRNRLCRAFAARGWEAIGAADGPSALELASQSSPDLAVVDLRLPGMSGIDIVQGLRSLDETTCIIMLTGYGSIATALTATKLGANHYLSKPADADQILNAYSKISEGSNDPVAEPGTHSGAQSGPRRMGAHSTRSDGLRRKCLAGGKTARPASPLAAAEAGQVSASSVRFQGSSNVLEETK